ncbi:probable E3 ubiquitin-protein ligase RNF217 [Ixodes scapularis]|nr:probable E3 ubiquitin-protein ligase RNF217 [Ixodes scapularis]
MAAVRLKTAQLCLASPQMPATLATTAPSRGSQTSASPPPAIATSESIHLDVEQRDAGMDPVPTTLAAHPRHKRGVKTPDLEQLRFILECFFISFGPECPQLGRNHPNSDPERYATGRHDSATSPNNGGSVSVPVSAVDPETFDHDALLREVLRYFEAGLEAGLDDQPVLVHQIGQERTLFFGESGASPPDEPEPHFPVGLRVVAECGICLEVVPLYERPCCAFPACTPCLRRYYASRVRQNSIQIECCNVRCHQFVSRDEISARLPSESKDHFHRLLSTANLSTKTCPHCNYVTKRPRLDGAALLCASCGLPWCFACHSPWHEGLSCRQFRKGDRLLKAWARTTAHGQVNAQRCPKCKIFIQRTTGCDHMHCARCKTHFCYRCGDRFRQLKFFGDHYSKLSVFGCKFRYKADKPLQRKIVRGAVFGGKLAAAPIVGVLALCAGVIVVGVGAFAFPLYGGLRLVQRYESRKKSVNLQSESTPRLVWFS